VNSAYSRLGSLHTLAQMENQKAVLVELERREAKSSIYLNRGRLWNSAWRKLRERSRQGNFTIMVLLDNTVLSEVCFSPGDLGTVFPMTSRDTTVFPEDCFEPGDLGTVFDMISQDIVFLPKVDFVPGDLGTVFHMTKRHTRTFIINYLVVASPKLDDICKAQSNLRTSGLLEEIKPWMHKECDWKGETPCIDFDNLYSSDMHRFRAAINATFVIVS
jgi:hypothetical protein